MAKKPTTITYRDIILGADSDTIRRALEARLQIDELIKERQAAYERIAALETQVEEVLGEAGAFPFPPPPMPVAGLDPKADFVNRAASPAPKKTRASAKADDESNSDSDTSSDETEESSDEDDATDKSEA